MPELGLFPLEMVLLPTERVPLHIFELRYQELIGECVDSGGDFGLVFENEEGTRDIGTRAVVVEVIDRFEDGRLNIVVEGRERFRILAETTGRPYRTAQIEPVGDQGDVSQPEARARALELYRALGKVVEQDVDEPDLDSGVLSFELAARVDFGPARKQELLELRSEAERLGVVSSLLEQAAKAITLERALAEAAAKNGHGMHHR